MVSLGRSEISSLSGQLSMSLYQKFKILLFFISQRILGSLSSTVYVHPWVVVQAYRSAAKPSGGRGIVWAWLRGAVGVSRVGPTGLACGHEVPVDT